MHTDVFEHSTALTRDCKCCLDEKHSGTQRHFQAIITKYAKRQNMLCVWSTELLRIEAILKPEWRPGASRGAIWFLLLDRSFPWKTFIFRLAKHQLWKSLLPQGRYFLQLFLLKMDLLVRSPPESCNEVMGDSWGMLQNIEYCLRMFEVGLWRAPFFPLVWSFEGSFAVTPSCVTI